MRRLLSLCVLPPLISLFSPARPAFLYILYNIRSNFHRQYGKYFPTFGLTFVWIAGRM